MGVVIELIRSYDTINDLVVYVWKSGYRTTCYTGPSLSNERLGELTAKSLDYFDSMDVEDKFFNEVES